MTFLAPIFPAKHEEKYIITTIDDFRRDVQSISNMWLVENSPEFIELICAQGRNERTG
jgi:hypothetical protein